jgi:ribosomal protein S8
MAFPKHIIDFIINRMGGEDLNSNEDEMLAKEKNKSFLQTFAERPSLEAQGLVPMPTEEMINSPTFKPEELVPKQEQSQIDLSLAAKQDPSQSTNFTLDVGEGLDAKQGLADAQRLRDDIILRHQISDAGKRIGAGISKGPVADRGMDNTAINNAGSVVTDYAQRIALDEQDPNSPVSKAFKQFAKKYNVDVKGDFTAAMGKQLVPFIFKSFEAEENRKSREELVKLKRDELSVIKKTAQESKDEAKKHKDYAELSKRIESNLARGNTPFGKMAGIVRSAEAIEKLVEGVNPNNLDKRQIRELAINLDAMLKSGASTVSGTNELIPHSWRGDASKIAEYITSRPQGAGQGAFVKRIIDTIVREKQLAQDQIKRTQSRLFSGYDHLLDNETEFKNFLVRNELPEDMYEHIKNPKARTESSTSIQNSGEMVKLQRKSTGTTKSVSKDLAQQYLDSDPEDFMIVK